MQSFSLFILICSFCIIKINGGKSEEIVKFALSKVGCGYIWGAKGQLLTENSLKEFKKKYPSFIKIETDKKWIGNYVFDCSGLVKSAFENVGIHVYHGANSAWENTRWALKGEIDKLPKDRVAILYKSGGRNMVHTGIYLGNGEVVNAKGSNDGVVKEQLGLSWTHFGIPVGIY